MIQAITKAGKINIDTAKEISQGGEGTIYEIDSNTVAKIYHQGIKPITLKKFQFLNKLDQNYFVVPMELLYDNSGLVIGYTMKYVDQTFFPLSSIYNKTFCKSSGITKKIKLKIIEKIIVAVSYAHKESVIIGDLNPFNILVNDKGVVKFIDTDSYQTPGCPHSHILLDDVRDYLFQGRVSEQSDYFAASILSFNMLSFLHPFKGIHSAYKKISDRMIHKLPVFINDPDIKIPKCYEPIQEASFMDQFKRLYINGERFLLSLNGVDNSIIATSPLAKPTLIKKYEQDELVITMITQNSEVISVQFYDKQGVIETETEFLIYDARNKGYLTLKNRVQKSLGDKIFVGNENILIKKDNKLWICKGGSLELLNNFTFPNKHIISQLGNILIVIGPDDMYKLFLDEVGAGVITTQHIGVYGKGFNNHNGLIHNSSGKQNVFYNSGKNISIVSSPLAQITGIYQNKNVGIIQCIENKNVIFKFFKINGMKMKISNVDVDGMKNFAFMPNLDSKGQPETEGMLFVPTDDKIIIYRTNDFEPVSEMKCTFINSDSVLFKCDAGIIAWEGNSVALLNKK